MLREKEEGFMPKLQREKLSNLAYQAIKEMVANHRFQPGARLNVEKLSKELGVSRTPVWEAVGRLEQEGLLRNIPNRGVFMVELTPQDALNLYQVRQALEGLAARLAAQRMNDRALTAMARNLDRQKGVVEAFDLLSYSRLDFEFHAAVYEACGNPYLQETLETIKNKMRPLTTHLQPILPKLYNDHTVLLAALLARDPDRAESAFRAHNQLMIDHIEQETQEGGWRITREGG
jgi:DNA-binding GntR family transcriptional regulator